MKHKLITLKIILLALLLPINSWATIGQNVLSINVDASRLDAKVARYDYGSYQIYELTPANPDLGQSYIREYLDPENNVVFAISWSNISFDAAEKVLGGYLMQAEDLAGDPQNKFDYNVGGTTDNYNGYFIINYYLPQNLSPNIVK